MMIAAPLQGAVELFLCLRWEEMTGTTIKVLRTGRRIENPCTQQSISNHCADWVHLTHMLRTGNGYF